MSKPVAKYWVNRHSMVDEHSAMRTSSDIPMYMASDVDALLRQREEEVEAHERVLSDHRVAWQAKIGQVELELARMTAERDQWKINAEFGNNVIAAFKQQLANMTDNYEAASHLADSTSQAWKASQARCKQLEEALKQANKSARDDARDIAAERSWKERQGDDYGTY